MSKWVAKRSTRAKVIEKPENEVEAWLLEVVRKQADKLGIGMPEVAIFPSPDPNAFATGMRRDNALVAVSTGLLNGMTKDEVDGVLAHEVGHIANGDMVTLALVQGVVNTFVIFFSRVIGHVIDRVVLPPTITDMTAYAGLTDLREAVVAASLDGTLAGGGPFTQDPATASIAARRFFRRSIIIPHHWGTFSMLATERQVRAAFGRNRRLEMMQPGQELAF